MCGTTRRLNGCRCSWRRDLRFAQKSTWKLSLDFKSWIGRMKTPPVYVDAIRSLLQTAPREVLDYFQVAEDGSFTLDSIMIEAG